MFFWVLFLLCNFINLREIKKNLIKIEKNCKNYLQVWQKRDRIFYIKKVVSKNIWTCKFKCQDTEKGMAGKWLTLLKRKQ